MAKRINYLSLRKTSFTNSQNRRFNQYRLKRDFIKLVRKNKFKFKNKIMIKKFLNTVDKQNHLVISV